MFTFTQRRGDRSVAAPAKYYKEKPRPTGLGFRHVFTILSDDAGFWEKPQFDNSQRQGKSPGCQWRLSGCHRLLKLAKRCDWKKHCSPK
jgi:hypothetical protein